MSANCRAATVPSIQTAAEQASVAASSARTLIAF
jgi:hypothetical protein